MLTVWINGDQRDGIDEGWIARRIIGLRHDGQEICIRVSVRTSDAEIALTAGRCGATGGAGRQPNCQEERLFRLWAECGIVGDPNFAPGQLIECLKRLERVA